MYIKGIYKRTIYNRDNYTVGLIKVKDNDFDPGLNDKTITFTGYFSEINIDDHLLLNGEFTVHNKYGDQFLTHSYEIIIPEEKDGIVSFLSSDIFKGIGEAKAQKIYDALGNDTIKIIINNPEELSKIKGLTKKNITVLHDKLVEYESSIDTIVKLNEYGFTNKDSTLLYNKYKEKTMDIIKKNVYDIIDEVFFYKKVDTLALRHNYDVLDKRRIKATILYVMMEVTSSLGNTYLTYEEIQNYLKRALLKEVLENLFDECLIELEQEGKIVNKEEKYYLTKLFYAEKNITKRFVYLNNQPVQKIKKIDSIYDEISKNNFITYNEKQKEAILKAFTNHFEIITGGPGTGKTTIIKTIVEMYQNIYKLSSSDMLNDLVLLAPTGKAAKRMMEKVSYPASTIHRFLKWNKDNNKFGVNEYNKAAVKMVIIDEVSMIDTYLLDSLLKGLYYDTKIILVGDHNQLPSIGPGQLLKDLIESNQFTVIKLNELYRQRESSNIITLARDINDGNFDKDIFNCSDDLTYIKADSYDLIDKLNELLVGYVDVAYTDIAILAPMYKTKNGIDNLNLIVREIFNPQVNQNEIVLGDTKYREGDKVILLVNMPDDNVYNGDVGIITEINNNDKEIYIDFDGNIVKFNKSNYLNFKLGYVISIHKAQGSEYKVVIIIMLNEYGRMLYRKLLYTAVTRAKSYLYLVGEEMAMEKAIKNNLLNERNTTLLDMINEMYEEKSIN